MQIVFLGIHGSCNLNQIGGVESTLRRTGYALADRGFPVSYVLYGYQECAESSPHPGVKLYQFQTYEQAMSYLEKSQGAVLVNGIKKADRIRFMGFRRKMAASLKFYYLASGFPESPIKRNLNLLEPLLYPYDGALCLSPRLVKALAARRNQAKLFIPPVPSDYFVPPTAKPNNQKLKVAFIGRVSKEKGGHEAFEILKRIKNDPNTEVGIYGYVWPAHKRGEDQAIYDAIVNRKEVPLYSENYSGWTQKVDENAKHILKNTDILLLPYTKLSTTTDTPLLLLEGMAAGCCVITKPVGDLATLYGPSSFTLPNEGFVENAVALIRRAAPLLAAERQRVYQQILTWKCSTNEVVENLISVLTASQRLAA